jgi:hypothetical protein
MTLESETLELQKQFQFSSRGSAFDYALKIDASDKTLQVLYEKTMIVEAGTAGLCGFTELLLFIETGLCDFTRA